jgi:hypothetical protein
MKNKCKRNKQQQIPLGIDSQRKTKADPCGMTTRRAKAKAKSKGSDSWASGG